MRKFIIVMITIFFLTGLRALAQEPTIENLIDSVNKTAAEFDRDFRRLTEDLENAVNSEALAKAKYDKMIQSVDKVLGSMSDKSTIWKTTDKLLEQFKMNKKYSEKKSRKARNSDYWRKSAAEWGEYAKRLRKVRDEILTERADLSNTRKEIMESKDIAIDMIKRNRAKQAISQMAVVKEHLKNVNQNLKEIVKRTKEIKASGAPS